MKVLLGIIIVILLIMSARFRQYAGYFIIIGISAVLISWQYLEYEKTKFINKISPSEINLLNISFHPMNNNYEMRGRIINNSEKYTLSGVRLKIIVKDCSSDDDSNCIIVSESNEYIYITVPPAQARDFKKEIYLFSNQSIKNKLVWKYWIEFTDSK